MPKLTSETTQQPAGRTTVLGSPLHEAILQLLVTANPVVLENDAIHVRFDCVTGALIGLTSKKTGWQVQRRIELGRSFRAYLGRPDSRFNPVEGTLTKLADLQIDQDNLGVRFRWIEFKALSGTVYPIEFSGRVRLVGEQLHFTGQIKNNSDYRLDTITWPIVGDLSIPAGERTLYRENIDYGTLRRTPLFPAMKNERGYWGTNYPMQMEGKGPSAPVITGGLHFIQRFVLLAAETQGVYLGVHDPTAKQMVCFASELRPGWTDSFHGRCPKDGAISEWPVYLTAEVIHYPFVAEGKEVALPEVVLSFYEGDWQSGVHAYRRWRTHSLKTAKNPAWLNEVHAWQQLQIGGAEDDLRTQFSELPQRVAELSKNGITVLQLVGWNHGGQDRGNPSHDPDPRLGGWEELKQAIQAIESSGVRVILFNKYVWADLTLPHHADLAKSAALDPYGIPYLHPGYEYQTPVQLMSINTRRFTVACLNDERWIELCLQEFQKSLDLGASGILYDEAFHHWSATHCFAEHHGHRVPTTLWSGDLRLGEKFREKLRTGIGEENFLLAAEAPFDLQHEHYGLSYFRISPGHIPAERLIDPFYPIMIAVCGFDDREMINRALLYRYIISYEPFNFKGDITDFPLTLEYGRKVDLLRRRYANFLWAGAYQHHQGVRVLGSEIGSIDYSVFVNTQNNNRAVVLINDDECSDGTVSLSFDSVPRQLSLVTPEDPEGRTCDPKSVVVKARSATVLLAG
jgi:hypothetical protein